MQISLSILRHSKDGYAIDLNRLVDLTKVFIKRDTDNWDRDFCVYFFEDENGNLCYIGMGRYYTLTKYSVKKWENKSRPFSHKKDLLSSVITKDWTCRIVAMGMTSVEAHVLEACLIANINRNLTRKGAKEWDRCSLINKKRERTWEKKISEFLGNGNNARIIAEGKTNDY